MSEAGVRHFRSLGRKRERLSAQVSPRAPSPDVAPDTSPDAAPEEAWLVDLSLGGACIELDQRFDPGRLLRVLIDLPGLWEPLELIAEVAWRGNTDKSGKALTGVRFVQPSGKALRLLSEALATDFR